ncbi:probable 2-oxoglutarate-dependent dioxygenase AOP1 [Lycium barbarum]|uniref:probable 2-oxoglutarate-dependent dioxygenase AOP1 n=1 Tax=Lycium barbarum TaxID=112863 RepID=UPI00293ED005|nr:probable 2-oxoglutarate-dependent dioxygenase AOP1 [Lycium barbarum]
MASNGVKIPIIDLSSPELKQGTKQWESTKIQVLEALQEYGCFEAIYDKVPSEIREAMFGTSKEIFEFPLETKLKNFSEKPFDGYKGQVPFLPLYESLSISDLPKPQGVETFANIFWPENGNLDFCNLVRSYTKLLMELDEMVKKMILESLGMINYIDEFLDPNSSFYFRFTRYKAPKSDEDRNKLGLIGHTDGNFMTIISQNQVNGLQILKKNGEWIDANVSPNSYVVLSGDSFMAWTNGRLYSPVHRVTMAGESDRFSIQLFSLPKPGYNIEAPKELVDEEHPLLFKPFEIQGLFEYVTSAVGYKADAGAFKAYCGV